LSAVEAVIVAVKLLLVRKEDCSLLSAELQAEEETPALLKKTYS